MNATEFEFRDQTLLHLVVVGAAFATYLADPVDIVWAVVEHRPDARLLEHLCFASATVLIGAGAWLRTSAFASEPIRLENSESRENNERGEGSKRGLGLRPSGYIGSVLFSVGVASLAPLPGAVILVLGESVLALRLILLERTFSGDRDASAESPSSWVGAVREESAKWGIFVTMIVFTWLLIDRVAEFMAIASLIVWAVLNYRAFRRHATR